MLRLSSLILSLLLLCGSAIAQTYERLPPGYPPKSDKPRVDRTTFGPVVEASGSSWVVVAWSARTSGNSIVRYGTERDQLTQTVEAPYVEKDKTHRVKIDNLQPGTTYYYIVDFGQGEGKGTIEQFTTRD